MCLEELFHLGAKKWPCSIYFALLCVLIPVIRVGAQEHSTEAPQSSSSVAQARSALAAGDPAEAARILSTHVQAHPKDTSARLFLAEVYTIEGLTEAAEQQYQAILQFAPENYAALAGLGELYDRTGSPERAEPLLAHAAKASHGAAKIKTEWAAVLARLHRYSDASRVLAGVTPPASREARLSFYRLKASIAAGLGDAGTAASQIEKALALSPNDPQLQMATTAAEIQAKHWKRAASLAGPLFSRSHDPRVGFMLLQAQLAIGDDIRPALELLQTVTLSEQQETQFRQSVADLLVSYDRFAEAAEQLSRAVELEPGRSDLRFNLALAEFRAGRLDDALATAQDLQKSADSAEFEDLLGDIQEARGDNLSAVRSYQAAIALGPNEEKYRLSLALELIRHKSFEPARVVLKQAKELHPASWRVEVALGMVEYFAGTAEDATRTLLRAAELAPDPEAALTYLGEIQMDGAGAPDSDALTSICDHADRHPNAGKLQFYCAALMFRRDYISHDQSHAEAILKRLNAAVKALPNDASPHCQLGKAYRWIENWQNALRESEICARMDPSSADAHYRLAQIYQHLGQQQRFEQEMKLYQDASARVADENARRDETIKTFLYSIQNETRERK
jgi:Flp pilus assembly protein TadD